MIIIPRIARNKLNAPFLHVMVQGINKEYIFYKNDYIEKYLKIFLKNKNEHTFDLIAYCIMSNHAHFLIYTEDITDFGIFMKETNQSFAQIYNEKEERYGVVFRNRYKTEPIYDKKYLINCIKYIHNNPVEAKIVSKCEDYPYSSFKEYVCNGKITKSKIMIKVFGENLDYAKMFNQTFDRRFMDIEESDEDIQKKYIIEGIREFIKEKNIELAKIFCNSIYFKEMVIFLYEECRIKYVEIRNFFEISKGAMDYLKIRDNKN